MNDQKLTPPPEPSLREKELLERVDWFIQLRWLAAAGTLLALSLGWYVFQVHFPVLPVLGTVLVMLIYNAVFGFIARNIHSISAPTSQTIRTFAIVQVIADLLSLTVLIHFLGGAENYFILFYFFHMTISSILLRRTYSYYLAGVAAVLVNGIIWGEYFSVLPHYHYDSILGSCRLANFNFQLMVSSVVTFSLFLTVYFSSSITLRLRMRENELESAYADLQKLDDEKSYFMRKASHELRSPITATQSLLYVLMDRQGNHLPDETREIIERVQRRLQEQLEIVNDLLRLSRLRSLDTPSNVEPLDFSEIIRQSCELFLPWAGEKKIELILEAEPCSCRGDRESLQQLVNNLISNGIKYTPAGGQVQVACRTPNDRIHFSVRDTGIGISEKDLPNLFREFFRAPNAKATHEVGTGLGLSIVKKIVEMHQGSIEVQSRLGEGTRFEVSLPALRG